MRKQYKKIGWLFNGVMIGLIIAGLIDHSVTALVIGAVAGLSIAAMVKAGTWLKKKRDLY